MSFVRPLVAGLLLATIVFAVVTLLTPGLSFDSPAKDASLSALEEARDARIETLEHRGVVSLLGRGAWNRTIEDEVATMRKKESYGDRSERLHSQIIRLDTHLAIAARIRDNIRYGVFVAAILTAFGVAIIRHARSEQYGPRRSGNLYALGTAMMLIATWAVTRGEHVDMWASLALAIVMIAGTVAASFLGAPARVEPTG